jgi:hemerythrin-like domain-containing protein
MNAATTLKTVTHPRRTLSSKARASRPASSSLGIRLQRGFEQVALRLVGALSSEVTDTVSAIKADHDGLRNFLGILKDTDADMTKRHEAYASFAALLKSHSMSEEEAVYREARKLIGREMHLKVAEGYVEHRLADDVMKRIKTAKDANEWSAHANVLSEIVEHHLKEEERDLLPRIRKAASKKVDSAMLHKFLSLRARSQGKVTKKNAGVLHAAK